MFTSLYTFVRRGSVLLALLSLFALGFARPVLAQNIDTTTSWNGNSYINAFGVYDTATYGQTITAPAGAALDSFTFYIKNNGGLTQTSPILAKAYVYAWDGKKATGSPLYASDAFTIPVGNTFQLYTMSTGHIPLTAGAQYVLFFTTSGLQAGQKSSFSLWGDIRNTDSTYTGGTFVYLNNANDFSKLTTSNWSVGNFGDLAFRASFSSLGFSIGTLDGAANAHALVTGFVTLRTPAPAGGETLSLSSDNAVATVPASVLVPEGASYATFPVQINSITSVNKANVPVTVTFGTTDGVEDSESSFTAYPAGITRADSYVQDGAGADTNFGTAPTLLVSSDGSGGSGNNRDAYLRFKFDGFHSVSKARLRVYASVSDGTSTPIGVYGVATNGWDQATLTFNNRPALTSLLKTFTASGASVVKYDIDVTPYVQAALASGKSTVSLALHLQNAATGTVSLVSKETVELKPQLILQGN